MSEIATVVALPRNDKWGIFHAGFLSSGYERCFSVRSVSRDGPLVVQAIRDDFGDVTDGDFVAFA